MPPSAKTVASPQLARAPRWSAQGYVMSTWLGGR
jgi:hypothetical protein